MVIVVPAFTHGNQRKEHGVSGSILGWVRASAHQVSQRIDAEGTVPEQHRGNNKTPENKR